MHGLYAADVGGLNLHFQKLAYRLDGEEGKKMIYYKTWLEKIPENCVECRFEMCTLPMKANGIDIKKSCVNKRHKDCPLVEVEMEEKG